MTKHYSRHWAKVILRFAPVFLSTSLFAAQLPNQILLNQEQQLEQQREELLKRPDIFLPQDQIKSTPIPPSPTDTVCFEIRRIELADVPANWQSWLQPLASLAQGKCMGIGQINQLIAELTNEIVNRGYTTSRVFVPEQNLKSGDLTLLVKPGRIRQLRLKSGGSNISLLSAFPISVGDILNIRDIEQGLEQLSRARSQHATMQIVPGDLPGESDIVVSLEHSKPVQTALSWDDAGQEATGKQQGTATISIDGLLGFNDVLSLSWGQDVEQSQHPRSRSRTVSWLLPWGNWTVFASHGEFDYEQLVNGTNQSFTSSGLNRNTLLSLSRLLHRNQISKTELALQLTRKSSRSYIESTEIALQKRDLSLAGLELTHRHYLGSVVLDAALGYTRGVSWFGAMGDALAKQGGPSAHHEVFSGQLGLSVPFQLGKQSLRWSSELYGQYSPDLLFGSEQFTIGGRYTVRGFDEQSLTGQSGYHLRNELSWSVPIPFPPGTAAELYAGLDAGQVSRMNGSDTDTHSLSGWAIGLRGALPGGLSAELSHERALHQPSSWTRPSITHFRLTLRY